MNKYKLAVILSHLEEHPNPKYHLEQFSITPGDVSATLFLAKKDIKNKTIYDLGCGTGRFAIGAALLGAKSVYGIDIDPEALERAKENTLYLQRKTGRLLTKICKWKLYNVKTLRNKCDTVVQFPPFKQDLVFLGKALKMARNVYSIHEIQQKNHIKDIFKEFKIKNWKIKRLHFNIRWGKKLKFRRKLMLVIVRNN